jgi:hypothetical protein
MKALSKFGVSLSEVRNMDCGGGGRGRKRERRKEKN